VSSSNEKICSVELVYKNTKQGNFSFGEIKNPPKGRNYSVWLPVVPQSIAVDSSGNLYVADSVNYRILSINRDDLRVNEIKLQEPSKAKPEISYDLPSIDTDNSYIYVVNSSEFRIEIYSKFNGKHFKSINYRSVLMLPKYIRASDKKIFVSDSIGNNLVYDHQGNILKKNIIPHNHSKSFFTNSKKNKLIPYGESYIAARGFNEAEVEDIRGRILSKCKTKELKFQLQDTGPIYYSRNNKELYVLEDKTLNIYRVWIE